MSKFTVYIDESGEAGILNVRGKTGRGASPYMTLGAALVKNGDVQEINSTLLNIASTIGKKDIHCNQLNHYQKVYVAKTIAKLPVTFFGVISLKRTLGWYSDKIDGDSKKFYNKCAQYLLECIGDFVQQNGRYSHQLDIVFEKGNFDYHRLSNLIRRCQDTPKGTQTQKERLKLLHYIDADKISASPKAKEPMLQLADVVAHSLFKSVDRNPRHLNILEPRYLYEIAPKFFRGQSSQAILGSGIKPIHSVNHFSHDREVVKILTRLDHLQTAPPPTNSPPRS